MRYVSGERSQGSRSEWFDVNLVRDTEGLLQGMGNFQKSPGDLTFSFPSGNIWHKYAVR